jgi:hypothetical protein
MGLVDSIRVLNNLKRRRIIRDYVLIGGVAATAYMEPVFTEDLDVVVMVDTDEEYLHLFQAVSSYPDGMDGTSHPRWRPSSNISLYRKAAVRRRSGQRPPG